MNSFDLNMISKGVIILQEGEAGGETGTTPAEDSGGEVVAPAEGTPAPAPAPAGENQTAPTGNGTEDETPALTGQDGSNPEGAQQPVGCFSDPSMLLMMGLTVFAIYFLILRPQKKQREERQKQISAWQVGDKIMTVGGMFGYIVHRDEEKGEVTIVPQKNAKEPRLTYRLDGILQKISTDTPPEEKKS
ncbi:MAG: preprotein translocase subunit YajC [Planctomycetes bacterium]|nr:preprotein translocase subunit YajC [Planctomycetota bacterium]